MLARQARNALALSEQLLKQAFFSRLPSRALATEATPSGSSSPEKAPPAPMYSRRRRKTILMVSPTVTERDYASRIVHGRSVIAPLQHEKKHGIPVAAIHVRGHNHRALDFFLHFASHAASALAIPVSQPIRLPTQRSLWTVPKGPFVHKKNQENFDRLVHKRLIKAWDATDNVVERWIRYIQTYPQPGIGLRIVRWRRAPVGIGKKHAGRTSKTHLESLKLENITDRQKVEEVARNIVEREMAAANLGEKTQNVVVQKNVVQESSEAPES